jgi:hypothetical protein
MAVAKMPWFVLAIKMNDGRIHQKTVNVTRRMVVTRNPRKEVW